MKAEEDFEYDETTAEKGEYRLITLKGETKWLSFNEALYR